MIPPVLSCAVCGGMGSVGEHRCPNCHGNSFVAYGAGTVLGWRLPLDHFSIVTRRVGRTVNMLVNVVLGILGFLFVLQLVVYEASRDLNALLSSGFWMSKSTGLLFFWVGVLLLFLLVSRLRRAQLLTVPVARRSYDEAATPFKAPQGWEELTKIPVKTWRDVSHSFTSPTIKAIERSLWLAEEAHSREVFPIHLFASLLHEKTVEVMFARSGVAFSALCERAERAISTIPPEPGTAPKLSLAIHSVLLSAYHEAYVNRQDSVLPTSLMPLLGEDPLVGELLEDLGINAGVLRNVLVWIRVNTTSGKRLSLFRTRASWKPAGNLDRAMTAVATPTLDQFTTDLTRAARAGHLPFMVGREKEMTALLRVFEGAQTSAILVGETGVGKEAILDGLAERMVEEDVPDILKDKRLLLLSVTDLVAGASAEETSLRLKLALQDIARARNIVLAVKNIEGFASISGGGVDLLNIFSTELGRGYFFAVATTDPRSYGAVIERRGEARVLQKIEVREPEQNEAIQIILGIVGSIEAAHQVYFTYPAIDKAVQLSDRYLHDRFLPEKAIEILKEAAQAVRTGRGERSVVNGEDVAAIVSEKSHVPLTAVTAKESDVLLSLEQKIHERVVGQEEAVKAVAAALRRGRTELRAKNRPVASFLFLGPTGVGKTELAKAVSAAYLGSEEAMVRLDMSEYKDTASISRLIGVSGGVGGGILTEAIRQKPFTLLLLDEFEKANPDVLNLFLQVMDDGRLTDNEGRTIDFTNVVLVATSNAGSQYILDAVGKGVSSEEIKRNVLMVELKGIYKPELLNRFDDVIVFKSLSKEEIEQICWAMMGSVTDMLATRGITFRASDEAVRELAATGFDPVFGARPMRRVIQERVENALADELLKNTISRRDTVVLEVGGELRVEKAKAI